MIAYLRGRLLEVEGSRAVVDAGGVGYEVHLTPSSAARLGPAGSEVELFVSESVAMYGGGTTLYAFLSREERQMFLCLRDHVPSTGAKKALEYLEKASRSLPDFRRAVLDADAGILCGAFGFTKKTADRLLPALKDHLGRLPASAGSAAPQGASFAQALEALASLGYRPAESRAAIDAVQAELGGRGADAAEVVRLALRKL